MSIKEPAPVSPAKLVRLKGVTGTGHCVHAITFVTRSPNPRFQSVSAASRSNLLIEGEITGPGEILRRRCPRHSPADGRAMITRLHPRGPDSTPDSGDSRSQRIHYWPRVEMLPVGPVDGDKSYHSHCSAQLKTVLNNGQLYLLHLRGYKHTRNSRPQPRTSNLQPGPKAMLRLKLENAMACRLV